MSLGAPVVVVGGGIAGVACAHELVAGGVACRLVDRGRRLGGRLGGRTWRGRVVDHGASYFTVSDPDFAAVVGRWERAGLARPWTDRFATLGPDGWGSSAGPVRYAAPGGLRSLVENLAAGLPTATGEVRTVDRRDGRTFVDGRPARAVVLALPDPQARRLLGPGLTELAEALRDPYEPVLAVAAAFGRRGWPADLDGVFVTDPRIAWVADDGARRGDDAPVLVAHSTADAARRWLDAPDRAAGPLSAALVELLDLPEAPVDTLVHRWAYARPAPGDGATREEPYHWRDGVGVCGDGWGGRPRVEAAYLSGRRLGAAIRADIAS